MQVKSNVSIYLACCKCVLPLVSQSSADLRVLALCGIPSVSGFRGAQGDKSLSCRGRRGHKGPDGMRKMSLFTSLKDLCRRSVSKAIVFVFCRRMKSCRGRVTRVPKYRQPVATSLTSPSLMRTLMRRIAPSKQP